MRKNEEVQRDVLDAIKWEPLLNAAEIGVTAKDGIVTLTGTVDSYTKKVEAEDAAKRVAGVKAIVEKIAVRFGYETNNGDTGIAAAALAALNGNWAIPKDKIQIEVENGWVTLEGELPWNYQKDAANFAIITIPGVMGVTNNVKIKAARLEAVEEKEIKRALRRNSLLVEHDIEVHATAGTITLTGTVDSYYEKDEASRIAWNAAGVCNVDNKLEIEYSGYLV